MGKVLLMVALTAARLMAEGPPPSRALHRISPELRREVSAAPSIITDVNLVLVPVIVTDRKGRTITGLRPENFRLLEDGAPRNILSFDSEDAPVSLGIVFDLSGSMKRQVPAARSAVRAMLDSAGTEDEVFLMTFADRPELRVAFTKDFESLPNSLLFDSAAGSTALIDAVYLALNEMRSARNPRKALLVVSDGADNNSRYRESELFVRAVEADSRFTPSLSTRTRETWKRSGECSSSRNSPTSREAYISSFETGLICPAPRKRSASP
jgi:Ca-activated chloride channel family protein